MDDELDKTLENMGGIATDDNTLENPNPEGEEGTLPQEPTEVDTSVGEGEPSTKEEYPDWLEKTGIPNEDPKLAKTLSRYKNEADALKAYGEIQKKAGRLANEVGEKRKAELQKTIDAITQPTPHPEEQKETETPPEETGEEEESLWGEEETRLTPQQAKQIARQEAQKLFEQQQRQILLQKAHEDISRDLDETTKKYPDIINKHWDFIKKELDKINNGGHSPFFAHEKPFTAMVIWLKGQEVLNQSGEMKTPPPKTTEGITTPITEGKNKKTPAQEILEAGEESKRGIPPL